MGEKSTASRRIPISLPSTYTSGHSIPSFYSTNAPSKMVSPVPVSSSNSIYTRLRQSNPVKAILVVKLLSFAGVLSVIKYVTTINGCGRREADPAGGLKLVDGGGTCPGVQRHFLWDELLNPCLKEGYSQGTQACQLDKIFDHIGTTNKYYVEYGFNSKKQCSGSGPNTCKLWKVHGWTGLLLDGDNENPEINLHAHYLYSTNAADVLKSHNVPEELDFLSGDMDSHDYFVMDNILKHFRPRVVTTEYNRNWPEDMTLSQIDPKLVKASSNSSDSFVFAECIWGASASALKFLMEIHGYELVGVASALDLIWGRKDVFSCYDIPPFERYVPLMRLGTLGHKPQQDLSIF